MLFFMITNESMSTARALYGILEPNTRDGTLKFATIWYLFHVCSSDSWEKYGDRKSSTEHNYDSNWWATVNWFVWGR